MNQRKHYRTVVISDIHVGYKQSKALQAGEFLSAVDCDRLILNGDIIDGWQFRKSSDKRWKPEYTILIKIIMKMMENENTEVVYVVGNHDAFFDHVVPLNFSSISILRDYVFESQGHRYFVTHGDIFDNISSNMKWLAKLGDLGYRILLRFNQWYNWFRMRRGKPYYSFSAAIKRKVKRAVSSMSDFEAMVVDVAKAHKCDGVICGHTHCPEDRMIGDVRYLNSGDWVESLSALVEDEQGNWTIIKY